MLRAWEILSIMHSGAPPPMTGGSDRPQEPRRENILAVMSLLVNILSSIHLGYRRRYWGKKCGFTTAHCNNSAFLHRHRFGAYLHVNREKQNKCFVQSRNIILFYIVLILCVDVCIQSNRGNKCLLWKWHVMLWLKFGDVVDSLSVRDRAGDTQRTGFRAHADGVLRVWCFYAQMENKNI